MDVKCNVNVTVFPTHTLYLGDPFEHITLLFSTGGQSAIALHENIVLISICFVPKNTKHQQKITRFTLVANFSTLRLI